MEHKDLSRALRRHHYARLKNTRKSYWGHGRAPEWQWTPRTLGMVVCTPHNCSCMGCGNSRKWFGTRTMQEQRVYQESVWDALDAASDAGEAGAAAGCNGE